MPEYRDAGVPEYRVAGVSVSGMPGCRSVRGQRGRAARPPMAERSRPGAERSGRYSTGARTAPVCVSLHGGGGTASHPAPPPPSGPTALRRAEPPPSRPAPGHRE
ncbi:unnamed protein product [Coccothraustes coccothraustes]